jgi:hypothetical protein
MCKLQSRLHVNTSITALPVVAMLLLLLLLHQWKPADH